jgi:hypothetical protein
MAIGAVRSASGIDRALATSYRRFTADAARDERATLSSNRPVRPLAELRERAAPQNSPAALLVALIERMGGAADSRTKGSYVNLRI